MCCAFFSTDISEKNQVGPDAATRQLHQDGGGVDAHAVSDHQQLTKLAE
jgi:hypothetical protein